MQHDYAAIHAACFQPWSQGQVKDRSIVSSCSNANPMDGLALVCYAIGSLRGLLELCTEDDADPDSLGQYK